MHIFETYPDKIRSGLNALGYNSSIVDMLYEWLGDLGYSGSLPDRMYQYLLATNRINMTHGEFISQLDDGSFFGEVIIQAFWERLNFWQANFWS